MKSEILEETLDELLDKKQELEYKQETAERLSFDTEVTAIDNHIKIISDFIEALQNIKKQISHE